MSTNSTSRTKSAKTFAQGVIAGLLCLALVGMYLPATAIAEESSPTDASESGESAESGSTDESGTGADAGTDSDTGSGSDEEADTSGSSDSEADESSGSVKYTTKTTKKTTYTLKLSSKTKKASKKNKALRTVKVSRPKIVTKTVTTTKKTNTSTGKTTTTRKTKTTTRTYRLNVQVNEQGEGWQKAPLNDAETYYVYTAAKGSYIQAVRIKTTSDFKKALKKTGTNYYYRASCKTFGKLGWAKAGQAAGSTGQSRAMTQLVVKVAKKIPGSTTRHFVTAPTVKYKVKVKGSKWSSGKNGSTAGKESWSTSTKGLAVKLSGAAWSGGVKYSVRTSKSDAPSNWSSWKKDFKSAGGGKVQAVKIKLTGKMAKYYDVYYRVYAGDHHWLGWAKNGQKAGTKNINYPVGAIEIDVVAKGAGKPGSSKGRFVKSLPAKGGQLTMLRKAQRFSSSTNYLVLCNRSACKVAIFTGSKNNWTLKAYWSCCVGKSSTPTISGSYTMGSKIYSFGTSSYTCYYASQIRGNYLFHSVLYHAGTFSLKDGTMGKAVSHGCVRLSLKHAKWMYYNVPSGSKIYIY